MTKIRDSILSSLIKCLQTLEPEMEHCVHWVDCARMSVDESLLNIHPLTRHLSCLCCSV